MPLAWMMDKVLLADEGDDEKHATGNEAEEDIAFSAGELSAMIDIVKDAAIQQGIMKAEFDAVRRDNAVGNPLQTGETLGFAGHPGDTGQVRLAKELAKDLVVHRVKRSNSNTQFARQDSTGSAISAGELEDTVAQLPSKGIGKRALDVNESVEKKAFLNRSTTPSVAKYRRYADEKQYLELEAETAPGAADAETKKEDMVGIVTLLLRLSIGTMQRGIITPLQFITPNAFQDRETENKKLRELTDPPSVGHLCCIPNDTVLDFNLLERLTDGNNVCGGLVLVHKAGRTSCFLGCVSVADIISIMAVYKRHEHDFDRKPLSRTNSTAPGMARTLSGASSAPIPIGGRTVSTAKDDQMGKRNDRFSNTGSVSEREKSDLPTIADVPLLMPLIVDEAASLLTTLRKHQQWLLTVQDKDKDRESVFIHNRPSSIGMSNSIGGSVKEPARCDLVLICHDATKFQESMHAEKSCHADNIPIGAMTLADLLQSAEVKRARVTRKLVRKRRFRMAAKYSERLSDYAFNSGNNQSRTDRMSRGSDDALDEESFEHEETEDDDDHIRRESEHVLEYIRSSYSIKREHLEVASRSVPVGNSDAISALVQASQAGRPGQVSQSFSLKHMSQEEEDLHSTSLSKSGLTLDHLEGLRQSLTSPRGSISQHISASLPAAQAKGAAGGLASPILSQTDREQI